MFMVDGSHFLYDQVKRFSAEQTNFEGFFLYFVIVCQKCLFILACFWFCCGMHSSNIHVMYVWPSMFMLVYLFVDCFSMAISEFLSEWTNKQVSKPFFSLLFKEMVLVSPQICRILVRNSFHSSCTRFGVVYLLLFFLLNLFYVPLCYERFVI